MRFIKIVYQTRTGTDLCLFSTSPRFGGEWSVERAGNICHGGWSFPPVFEDNSIAREQSDRSMESIRFETSTPSSGSDSIVDTSVIIFASLSLRKLVGSAN